MVNRGAQTDGGVARKGIMSAAKKGGGDMGKETEKPHGVKCKCPSCREADARLGKGKNPDKDFKSQVSDMGLV